MDKGFAVALRRLLDNCYPERQFILRSRGEVGFITLGQKSQVALSLGGLLFLGWLAYSSVGVFLQLDVIAGKDAQIAQMVGAHNRLNADMRAVENRYRQITLNLEDNQKILGDVLLQRANLDRKRAELLRELKKTRKQRDMAYHRGAKLQARLAKLEGSLRRTLAGLGGAAAPDVPILYGGSVDGGNIASFLEQPDVDGALVGGASLKPDEFTRIVEETARLAGR